MLSVVQYSHATEPQAKQVQTPIQLPGQTQTEAQPQKNISPATAEPNQKSLIEKRLAEEKRLINNAFALTQHRANYLLPYSYVTNPNPIGDDDLTENNVDNSEAKFQLSVKLPLYLKQDKQSEQHDSIDGLYFGFTLVSYWQVYNSEVSKPFRENNYEPEVFYMWEYDLSLLGYDFNSVQLGVNHMSNGQSGLRSRSWNRVFANFMFSDEDEYYYLKTWYRIPEDAKTSPDDPEGDDNPNITDYYGRAEIGLGKKIGNFNAFIKLRNNLKLSGNRGSIELNLSYPMSPRYDIMLQYFNGYGDSLLGYDRAQQRIGVGVNLTIL